MARHTPSGLATALLVGIIQVYRVTLSWCLGGCCRFVPSCSRYAQAALRRHGAARGLVLVGRRLMRCHPWNAGGLDPVPAARVMREKSQRP